MRVGVRWHTGATDELTIVRPGPGRTPAAALELIRRYGASHTSTEIAEMLTAAGLATGKGKPFTAGGVARVRDAYKIFGPPNRRRPRRRGQRQKGRRRARYPRRRRLRLVATRASPRPQGSERTLVYPLGSRYSGDLSAEGRQLVPAQTDAVGATDANPTDGRRL